MGLKSLNSYFLYLKRGVAGCKYVFLDFLYDAEEASLRSFCLLPNFKLLDIGLSKHVKQFSLPKICKEWVFTEFDLSGFHLIFSFTLVEPYRWSFILFNDSLFDNWAETKRKLSLDFSRSTNMHFGVAIKNSQIVISLNNKECLSDKKLQLNLNNINQLAQNTYQNDCVLLMHFNSVFYSPSYFVLLGL